LGEQNFEKRSPKAGKNVRGKEKKRKKEKI
jgi:hypothetical protein